MINVVRIFLIAALTGLSISHVRADIHVDRSEHVSKLSTSNPDKRLKHLRALLYLRDPLVVGHVQDNLAFFDEPEHRFEFLYILCQYHLHISGDPDAVKTRLDQLDALSITHLSDYQRRYDLIRAQWLGKTGKKKERFAIYRSYLPHYINLIPEEEEVDDYLTYMTGMSMLFRQHGIPDSAAMVIQKAQLNAPLSDCGVLQYYVSREASRVYNSIAQNGKALMILQGTYDVTRQYAVPFDLAYYHYYMAKYLLELEEYEDAHMHLNKCIKLCEQNNLTDFWGVGLINLGVAFHGMDSTRLGLQTLAKAMRWYKLHDASNTLRQAIILINMANHHSDIGEYPQADSLYHQVTAFCEKENITHLFGPILNNRAALYRKMERYQPALDANLKAEDLLRTDDFNQLSFLYQTRERLYRDLNNYQQAYNARVMLDSVLLLMKDAEERNLIVFHRAELEQESYKQQLLETELLYEQKQGRRKLVIALLTGLLALLIVAMVLYMIRVSNQKNRTKVEVSKLKELSTRSKLEALQSQITPHFMFNSLNTFQYLLRNNETERAMDYLTIFSGLLRDKVFTSGKEFISVHHELNLLEKYMEIEKMRVGKQIDFQITIADGLNAHFTGMPPMIVQPLLENAIWHGAGRTDHGIIKLHLSVNDYLTVIIEDNGPGYALDKNKEIPSKSYGIKNVLKRLNNIRILYRVPANLDIYKIDPEDGTGTLQVLTLPKIDLQ